MLPIAEIRRLRAKYISYYPILWASYERLRKYSRGILNHASETIMQLELYVFVKFFYEPLIKK